MTSNVIKVGEYCQEFYSTCKSGTILTINVQAEPIVRPEQYCFVEQSIKFNLSGQAEELLCFEDLCETLQSCGYKLTITIGAIKF